MAGNQKGLSIQVIVGILLVLALFLGWLGYQPGTLLNEYARGLGLTLLGVALVVYLTDSLGHRREQQLMTYLEDQRKAQEDAQLAREGQLAKTQLIREIASGDAGLATRAIRELDSKGWLTDGTLANTHLASANLKGANLGWVNLSGAFLSRINLQGADVSYGNFSGANMSDALLGRANLDLADMTETDLRGADISLGSLNETNLTGAALEGAILSGAAMVEANLTKAQGERVALNGANLERANLVEANLAYANMERATLIGANLGWANLGKVNLEKANLSEANLSGANLDDARLHGANLSGAFLFGARVSLKALSTAKTLANATMPDGTKYEDWIRRQSGEYVAPTPAAPPAPISSATYGVAESPLDYVPTAEEIF
ncbi:protein of unknown function [Candidatus Promineifilum breve]|uniref:Pentapeptide repeat protein n=1 Tax=Candidatus Promineifilum breve TaxID=1806508 RepID=A0A160T5H1_9CHLR|nr:pentapeptide repeat-containing protein [Candidatus Promineifilum breve]CUS05164.2 protein of unknown function [Candidatus Promineifilum breve]